VFGGGFGVAPPRGGQGPTEFTGEGGEGPGESGRGDGMAGLALIVLVFLLVFLSVAGLRLAGDNARNC
jgi:hypothetical protein